LIKKAATGLSFVRVILETYNKDILKSVSDQFLDLVIKLRLKTISVRDLVNLLAKAKRLDYSETDVINNKEAVY
jgi:hypothetical protein